ncbi:hypothetical protein [Massilia cavernae]|uniref:hypothetical protein n=1 Tax=Massilia cavernae TaxID=2320864 RepID=UPI0011C4377D|nr:hypothetical protein [Massilia cavernae]
MDKLFGKDNWLYDQDEQLYIARDPKHTGPGFGFIAARQSASFFTGARPDEASRQRCWRGCAKIAPRRRSPPSPAWAS